MHNLKPAYISRLIACSLIASIIGGTAVARQLNNGVEGTVRDGFTGKPLQAVSVFLNNTYIGTATNINGDYRLRNIPPGSYTLVFSSIGYTRKAYELSFPAEDVSVNPELYPVTINLGEVEISREADRQWRADLEYFRQYFLGHTRNASHTRIRNPEVLHFIRNKDRFHAWATEPLSIRNEALGYHIDYHLESLIIDDGILYTNGFAQYRQIKRWNPDQPFNWRDERIRAYRGSYRHFLNALVADRLRQEGFSLYFTDRTYSEYHEELPRPKLIPVTDPGQLFRYNNDFRRIELLNPERLPFLRIDYDPEVPEAELVFSQPRFSGEPHQISWIEFPAGKVLVEFRTAHEVSGYRSVLHGYWGWASRLPELLPKEFQFPAEWTKN